MSETSVLVSIKVQPRILTAPWLCALYVLLVLLVYHETLWSIVAIWNRSDTYTHGYLIPPIVLWLIWRRRAELDMTPASPSFRMCLLLIPCGLVWLLAHLVDVLVIQQLALIGILIAGIWAIVGHTVMRLLTFPLGFLFLAVPMGEDLVPPMMEFTATSTVWLVQLTGIPVYREGLFFTLPSGSWSVVEACSGVRYLIASFTLGLLYAHLSYRSLIKQILFVLASLFIPILANSIRAYIIVMLGHVSGMKLATGVDHLIYGWVFFGLVMLLLFWAGSFWRDADDKMQPGGAISTQAGRRAPAPALLPVFLLSVMLASIWPLFATATQHAPASYSQISLQPPPPSDLWERPQENRWELSLRERGADAELVQFYYKSGTTVALYLQQYMLQREGAELVSGRANQVIDESGDWRVTGQESATARLAGKEMQVQEVQLGDGYRKILLWYWYRIGDHHTANRYVAKVYELLQAITFGRSDAALIVVATEMGFDEQGRNRARDNLQAFVTDYLNSIETSLDSSAADLSR